MPFAGPLCALPALGMILETQCASQGWPWLGAQIGTGFSTEGFHVSHTLSIWVRSPQGQLNPAEAGKGGVPGCTNHGVTACPSQITRRPFQLHSHPVPGTTPTMPGYLWLPTSLSKSSHLCRSSGGSWGSDPLCPSPSFPHKLPRRPLSHPPAHLQCLLQSLFSKRKGRSHSTALRILPPAPAGCATLTLPAVGRVP